MTSKLKLENGILKLLLSISYLLIILASIILYKTSPANGYELDIYSTIPNSFFISIYLSMLISIFIGAYISFNFKRNMQLIYCLTILNIILNNYLFQNIKFLRGYAFFDRGDMINHIFEILKISSTNHLDSKNFYPATHILGSSLYEVCGLEITKIDSYISIPFSILYILSMYILAKKISSDNKFSLLVSLASAIPVTGSYGIGFYPANISTLLLPLTLYIIYLFSNIKNKISSKICAVTIILLYPLIHPLTSVILIGILLLLYAIESIYGTNMILSLTKKHYTHIKRINVEIIFILFITFISWFSMFSVWALKIREIYNIIFTDTVSPLSDTLELANKVQFSIFDIFELMVKMQGGALIYASIAIILAFVYLKQNNTQEEYLEIRENIFAIFAFLLLIVVFQLIVILFPTGIDTFRPLRYTVIFTTILLGLAVFIKNNTSKKETSIKVVAFTSIFGILIGLSIMSYPSPYQFTPNPQITYQDIAGTKWIEENKNQNSEIIGIWPYSTYVNVLAILEKEIKSMNKLYISRTSDHFGYDTNNSIAKTYNSDTYLPIFEYDRDTQLVLWYEAEHFYKEDFQKLSRDSSVDLIYESGETEVWKV